MVVVAANSIVGISAGLVAAVQNYRRPAAERRTPRGLTTALVGVAMLALGAILAAAIPQENGRQPRGAGGTAGDYDGRLQLRPA
ncbi:MAG TPA: hypothetical protein VF177_17830 [Anaerolineae bacterium]